MAQDPIIIGAGPAGLATAGCLAQRGIGSCVLEQAAQVGDAWRHHYDRLHLHTVKSLSSLPGLPFPAAVPRYASREQLVDYLEAYAAHFRIAPSFGETVVAVAPSGPDAPGEGGRWRVRCASGREERSDTVVFACGANRIARMPGFPGQANYRGRILHSRDYRNPAPFAGQRVLVVGMGNTGAEIALDLAEQAIAVSIAARSPLNIVRRDALGVPIQVSSIALGALPPALGDSIGTFLRNLTVGRLERWGLRTATRSPLAQMRLEGRTPVIDIGTLARIRRGEILARPGIDRFTADGVMFTDGRAEPFDAVIMATGFDSGLQAMLPDTPMALDDKGMPRAVLGSGATAGLAFVGFDLRQPGGVLRAIAAQARQVAAQIPRAAEAYSP